MIAELFEPFQEVELNRKIAYHLGKIEKGVARELFNSVGDSLKDMCTSMPLVASLNDRVKLPYIEIVLSSPIGEDLTDSKFVMIANEYMKEMGYAESCYSIVKHNDKDNKHIHIVATKVDLDGIRIDDSMSKIRSGTIMRNLEIKYGLEVMEKGNSSNNKTLGESQYRQYFFDTALHKALRSHNAKERVTRLLNESDTYKMLNPLLSKSYTNLEWKTMLGDEVYDKLLKVLSDSKFFNPLYKEELLATMDRIYPKCKNMNEFREKLKEENVYSRLISDKGKSYYVYGIPERNFYVKDKALPEKYRFGKIAFDGQQMTHDEQKHYLYNKIFTILNNSSSYDGFKKQMAVAEIKMIEHSNKSGIYGLSFSLTNINSPEVFKSSDVSRRLTYKNIMEYFQKEEGREIFEHDDRDISKDKSTHLSGGAPIKPIIVCYINNKQEWEREISYMSPVPMILSTIPLDIESEKRRGKKEDDLSIKKRKKRKNKGLSI